MKGHLGHYNLFEWWTQSFTESEKVRFKELYKPMGGSFNDLINGNGSYMESAVWFLTGLAGFASNKSDLSIALKFLEKAESLIKKSTILDKHFLYGTLSERHYKLREDIDHYAKAIYYCKKQIEIAGFVKKEFIKEFGDNKVKHWGYYQLTIILQKEKKYKEAILLCEKAMEQGWKGDWENRIEKLKKY